MKCFLTGNCRPKAYRTLEAAGIEVVIGVRGTVREALDRAVESSRARIGSKVLILSGKDGIPDRNPLPGPCGDVVDAPVSLRR